MNRFAVVLLGLTAAVPAFGQHRCVDNGKILITDKPCAGEMTTPAPAANVQNIIGDKANGAYASGYGDWRGQVQYQASLSGQPVADAHAVVQTTVSIGPQGKVTGISPENGCKMKGIASPGMTPTILNLDITLSGCSFQALNRRLSGTLALYPAQKHAQLWLYAQPVDLLRPGQSYELKGTMRR